MRTTAVRKGDHYVINGYKRWITKAQDADFLQLVAATDRSKGSRGGLSMFLVDTADARRQNRPPHADDDERHAMRDRLGRRDGAGREPDRQGR